MQIMVLSYRNSIPSRGKEFLPLSPRPDRLCGMPKPLIRRVPRVEWQNMWRLMQLMKWRTYKHIKRIFPAEIKIRTYGKLITELSRMTW